MKHLHIQALHLTSYWYHS